MRVGIEAVGKYNYTVVADIPEDDYEALKEILRGEDSELACRAVAAHLMIPPEEFSEVIVTNMEEHYAKESN